MTVVHSDRNFLIEMLVSACTNIYIKVNFFHSFYVHVAAPGRQGTTKREITETVAEREQE